MTNASLTSNKPHQPFVLRPVGKDYLWGGNRLNDDFAKEIPMSPLAETWECSTHPAGICSVASGIHEGKPLTEVLKDYPEMLGRHANEKGEIPILIKLIDARENLSVQVHPDDEYAKKNEDGSLGKTEMWYVLDAAPGSEIIYGFRKDTDKEEVKRALDEEKLPHLLRRVPIKKNELYYIRPGIVHAISKGALLAEVQESSDITYRLYDYHRKDKDGNLRPLHIDKALEVMDYSSSENPRQPIRVLKYTPGCASEILCRCKYFQTERLLINTEKYGLHMSFPALEETFQVLLCTDGSAKMVTDEETVELSKGKCVFVPAGNYEIKLHGMAQFLKVRC